MARAADAPSGRYRVAPMASDVLVAERHALCDTLAEVGPDAPTLCEGWAAADLAAHLVVRERDLVALPGILVERFAPVTARRMERVKAKGFDWMVQRLRRIPPNSRVPRGLQVHENFVHHEDLRRARGDAPRPPDAGRDAALAVALRSGARLTLRHLGPVGVTCQATGGGPVVLRQRARMVTASGDQGELNLYFAGRKGAARVALAGDPVDVEAVRAARFGI